MPLLQTPPMVLGADAFTSDATQRHPLGTYARTRDGRTFRYCKAGASALVAGNVIQSAAILVNHLANTPPAVAIGATSFSYTPGATAGAANLYGEGYLGVSVTPGLGYTYQISGHAAISSSTAFTLNLIDAVQIALTTSSRVGILANPYKNVIQFPVTTATGIGVGVAGYVIAASEFGWIQSKGIGSVLIAGTPALGAGVMTPSTTAGSAVVLTTTNLVVAQLVGFMAQIGVDGECNFVYIKME